MLAFSKTALKLALSLLLLQSATVCADNGDDGYVANNDDWNATQNYYGGDGDSYQTNNGYELSFSEMLVMPQSCIRWNNGYMIKYELYENTGQKQCHSNSVGTFLISIAHYMHAHFNYQALSYGEDFSLPWDAGYLNCVKLPQTMYSQESIYAKIGCDEHGSGTSLKLALHLYKDKYCSRSYNEDSSHRNGYKVNGRWLNNNVSFKPNFYKCQNCSPEAVSDTFSRGADNWYDDDYINVQGKKKQYNNGENDDGKNDDGGNNNGEDENGDENDAAAEEENANETDDANQQEEESQANDDAYYLQQIDDASYFEANDDSTVVEYYDDDAGANEDGAEEGDEAEDNEEEDANDADEQYYAAEEEDANDEEDEANDAEEQYYAEEGDDNAAAGDDNAAEEGDDNAAEGDDAAQDDQNNAEEQYYAAEGDDGNNQEAAYYANGYYAAGDDGDGRNLKAMPAPEALVNYQTKFWEDIRSRKLGEYYNEDEDSSAEWNFCHRLHHYGVWCDEDCQSISQFHVDQWSNSDLVLLVTMCVFIGVMMLLVFAKRVKSYEKAMIFDTEVDAPHPGLPPIAMAALFAVVLAVIMVMASMKLVNETLIFAVVACLLLFCYMLKLTFFDNSFDKEPQVMHETMSKKLFDTGVV